MSAVSTLKKDPQRNTNFHFLKRRYLVIGGPTDMNVNLFSETPASFLKSVRLQLFPKYRQIYVNFNVKSSPKFNGS